MFQRMDLIPAAFTPIQPISDRARRSRCRGEWLQYSRSWSILTVRLLAEAAGTDGCASLLCLGAVLS